MIEMGRWEGLPGAAARCQKRAKMKREERLPGAAVSCQRMAEKEGGREAPILISRSFASSWSTAAIPGQSFVDYVASAIGKDPFGFSGSKRGSFKYSCLFMF
jgi:hypothetical protein